MRVLLKGLLVFVIALLTPIVLMIPLFFPNDWSYPDWLGTIVFFSPFGGAVLGGFLVSRNSTRGGKIGWIVGGGLLLGFIAWCVILVLLIWIIASALSGVGMCC